MKELPIHIELEQKSGKTLYEQIYEYIREEIRKGNLCRMKGFPPPDSSRIIFRFPEQPWIWLTVSWWLRAILLQGPRAAILSAM